MSFTKFRNQFFVKVKRYSMFNSLPAQHCSNLTKLIKKLQQVEIGRDFKTPFNKEKTLLTFMRLDYNHVSIILDRKFDAVDELILNSIYSFGRDLVTDSIGCYKDGEYPIFSARKILQHIFGNVSDHFQKEIVSVIEERIDDMSYMKLTFDLRDNLGNSAYVNVDGDCYHPVALRESLLDVSVLEWESQSFGRRFQVYRLNRKSPIFIFAERLKQVTSWSTHYMAVPCRKTIQNAVIMTYLLTKISLIGNRNNRYINTGILFDTLHEELNLDVTTRKKKKVIRDNIKIMFDYWQKIGLIMSYEFKKVGKSYHKIVFKVNLTEAEKC